MTDIPRRPTRSTPSGAPNRLLATKLHLPHLAEEFVSRGRLLDQLDAALTRRMTVLSAPAGSGKTTLLADWSQRSERPVAWLSLDAGDNDPARFWRHVCAALAQARPGIAVQLGPLLDATSPTRFDGVVTALVNELMTEPGDVVMVLDDYHVIDADPVHASLTLLLEHLPPGMHVMLASRTEPPLPLARFRARGQLAELHAIQLQFTAEEAAALLRALVHFDLGDEMVSTLTSRTEGWAAGLQLAGLSLQHQPDAASFVTAFSGSHRYILDFLTEEVLSQQPEPVRAFLLETSLLERLSGPLCDAVTGRRDSQRLLEAIERANLFLVPLDETRGWWRYHHLFGDLLRTRLEEVQPDIVPQLHRNAASWHDRHGPAADAVRHALASQDPAWAAGLIERHFDEFYLSNEGATVARWLTRLPAELVASRPRLNLVQAALNLINGRVDEVEGALAAAERARADADEEPFEPSVGWNASRLANVPAAIAVGRAYTAHNRADGDATMTFASQALAEVDESEWMLSGLARTNLAIAPWLRGDVGQAEGTMAPIIAHWRASGRGDLTALAASYLGRIQSAQGRLDAAVATYEQSMEMTAVPGRPPPPATGILYVGMADVAYERDELDTALRLVLDGIALCRQFIFTEFLAWGLVTLAHIRQAEGDAAAAVRAMEDAGRVADPGMTDLFNVVPAQQTRLLLAQGDLAGAAAQVAAQGLDPDDMPTYPRESAYLVLARVLLAEGRPDQALRVVDRLLTAATAQGRTGSVIQIQALRALGLAAIGEDTAAVAALTDALVRAHPSGYVRVFVDEGVPMGELLGRVLASRRSPHAAAHAIPGDYLGRLTRAFERGRSDRDTGAASPGPVVPGLVTPLTDRELQVLLLVAEGRPNREIAAELFVALSTVKKHVTHILEKVGAANRTAATARARELGLLD